jgi:hypothetical protein
MTKIESEYKEMMDDVQMSGSMIAYCMKAKALELESELTAVTEQRDAITLRLGRTQERMFNAERQRDRLADLVKQFISILDITEESDGGRSFHPTNITSCRAGDLQKIGGLVEALRRASRTTNPNKL